MPNDSGLLELVMASLLRVYPPEAAERWLLGVNPNQASGPAASREIVAGPVLAPIGGSPPRAGAQDRWSSPPQSATRSNHSSRPAPLGDDPTPSHDGPTVSLTDDRRGALIGCQIGGVEPPTDGPELLAHLRPQVGEVVEHLLLR